MLFKGMAGSHLPVAIAHGEGKAEFLTMAPSNLTISGFHYVMSNLCTANIRYPYNPNGSAGAIASVTSTDGRAS